MFLYLEMNADWGRREMVCAFVCLFCSYVKLDPPADAGQYSGLGAGGSGPSSPRSFSSSLHRFVGPSVEKENTLWTCQ